MKPHLDVEMLLLTFVRHIFAVLTEADAKRCALLALNQSLMRKKATMMQSITTPISLVVKAA